MLYLALFRELFARFFIPDDRYLWHPPIIQGSNQIDLWHTARPRFDYTTLYVIWVYLVNIRYEFIYSSTVRGLVIYELYLWSQDLDSSIHSTCYAQFDLTRLNNAWTTIHYCLCELHFVKNYLNYLEYLFCAFIFLAVEIMINNVFWYQLESEYPISFMKHTESSLISQLYWYILEIFLRFP